jgi:hypothetical protein
MGSASLKKPSSPKLTKWLGSMPCGIAFARQGGAAAQAALSAQEQVLPTRQSLTPFPLCLP